MNEHIYSNINMDDLNILIVDDDQQVIEVSKFVLEDYVFHGRKLNILEALSPQEAINILKNEPDISVSLIDIIMDEDDSGLKLIDFIRNELKNNKMRLIIRTGQPGIFPPEDIFFNYDINDYLNKNDLSNQRLIFSLTSAIRSYFDILLIENITNQKLEQEEILLAQSKNAAIGEMLQAITHQWSQPLTILKMASELISREYKMKNDIKEYLSQISDQIDYMSTTLHNFKNFFSPYKKKMPFNISEAVNNAVNLISKKHININFDHSAKYFSYGYINELSEIFIIMFNNTIDAAKENKKNKKADIKIDIHEKDENIIINFSDNAGGIPENILKKIFSKYNTSKENGTGIGLYLVKVILEQEFNGKIKAQNNQEGAVFEIMLPKYKGNYIEKIYS